MQLNSKGLYQSSRKEMEVVVLCSRPRQNVKLGNFSRRSRATTATKCTEKRDARAKCCLPSKPVAFLPFLLPSPSSLLKLSIFSYHFLSLKALVILPDTAKN